MLARLVALALLCSLPLCAGTRADEPLKIRIGSVSIATSLPSLVTFKPEILSHYGKTYVSEAQHFSGTSQEFTALSTGDVEMISIAYSSLGAAVINGHLDDIRIILDCFQDGADGYLSTPYLVRNDSPIKTIEDFKGKIALVNEIGSAVDIGMRAMLRAHHLEATKDYTVVEAPFPAMGAMVLSQRADIMAGTTPSFYNPQIQNGTRAIFMMKESMGRSQMIAIAARAGFLEKNRAALKDFFEDLVHGIHWMRDPANRTEMIAIVAKATKTPVEQLEGWYMTGKDYYHDPDGVPDIDALQRNIDTQQSLGFLKTGIDVKKYSDLSFIQAAAKQNAGK